MRIKFMVRALGIVFATCVAYSAVAKQVIIKTNELSPVRVEKTSFSRDSMFVDTIGLGTDEWNWGGPLVIGQHGDKPVRVGYDYNYLTHIVYLGDEIIAQHPSLLFVDVDSAANTAVMLRDRKKQNISFSDPRLAEKINSFISAPVGYEQQSYSFVIGDENIYKQVRKTIGAEIPEDKLSRRVLLNCIVNNLEYVDLGDTIRVPQREINTLYDAAKQIADIIYLNRDASTRIALDPATVVAPMQGMVAVDQWDVGLNSPRYITFCYVSNQTYPAGGCRNSYTEVVTIDKTTGKSITPEDIFINANDKNLKKLFFKTLSDDLIETEAKYNFIYYDSKEEMMKELRERYSPLAIAYAFADGPVPNLSYNDLLPQTQLPQEVALTTQGVVFNYSDDPFSETGENGLWQITIPFDKIKKYLKEEFRELIKHTHI